MKFDIEGLHLSVTPSLKAYTEHKFGTLARLLRRFEERGGPITFFMELGKTSAHHRHGDVFFVRITATVDGKTLHVEARHEDMRAAIDGARDTFKRDLVKHKDRVTNKVRAERVRRVRRKP